MPHGRGTLSSKIGMIRLTSQQGNAYFLRSASIVSVARPNAEWKACPRGINSVIVMRGGSERLATETPEEIIRLMEEALGG